MAALVISGQPAAPFARTLYNPAFVVVCDNSSHVWRSFISRSSKRRANRRIEEMGLLDPARALGIKLEVNYVVVTI